MNTPPLLLGAALLLWGWHVDLPFIAIFLAVFFEGSRFIRRRLNFSIKALYRIWDLCSIFLLVAAAYLYTLNKPSGVVLNIIQWTPLIFLPIMAAQAFGNNNKMELSVFFLMLRKSKFKGGISPQAMVNISYPYLVLCIAASSASNLRTLWFYGGVFFLVGWALWFIRSGKFSFFTWGALLLLAGILGYGGGMGLHRLQKVLEERFVNVYAEFLLGNIDPFKTSTAIGEIGTLKLSGKIVFQVESKSDWSMLLTQTSYNIYRGSSWYTVKSLLKPLRLEPDGKTWVLQKKISGAKELTISTYLSGGKGILALPEGSFQIEKLPAGKMLKNRLGAVKVEEGPGFAIYKARFNPAYSLNAPPDEMDLRLPEKEAPVISKISDDLDLLSMSPKEILRRTTSFFRKNFKYSLELESGGIGSSPLEDFLLRTRVGHCEYFATATVLLLRRAGIPARYAVGYQIHEYDAQNDRFLVRERDAHAWAIAYVEEKWMVVDTTPIVWIQMDKKNSSFFEPLSDLWSQCVFLFSAWRWGEKEKGAQIFFGYLLVPLLLLLAWRITTGSKLIHEKNKKEIQKPKDPLPGLDSVFFKIEKRLTDLGLVRYPGETIFTWVNRLEAAHIPHVSMDSLKPAVELHYRHRFDPLGITIVEKVELKNQVDLWLRNHPVQVLRFKVSR